MRKTGQYLPCELCGKIKYHGGDLLKKCKYHFCGRQHFYNWKFIQFQNKFPKEFMNDLYTNQQKTFRQISKIANINERTVHKLLTSYKISIRKGGEAIKPQWINNENRRLNTAIRFVNNVSKVYHPSKTEKDLIDFLKSHNIDFQFQVPIHRYILDFVLPKEKIDIELDGREHKHQPKLRITDSNRDKYLSDKGWKIIRIPVKDFEINPNIVLEKLTNIINRF